MRLSHVLHFPGTDAQTTYTITTKAERISSLPGKSIKLNCHIKNAAKERAYELDASWHKMQVPGDTSGIRMSASMHIEAPFKGTARFSLVFQASTGPNVATTLELSINSKYNLSFSRINLA